VNDVDNNVKANRQSITDLEQETLKIKDDIQTLFRLSTEFRQEMDELSQKVAELYVLKKQMADQKEFVDELATKFQFFSDEVSTYMTQNTAQVDRLQKSNDDTVFQLKEMKDYVDHFADNLILNSQQIMVDVQAGFGTKPTSLTEVLKTCNSNFYDIDEINTKQDEQITKIFADLDTKAPDSVLFNISTLEKKVATIELHIKKEEEQGMGALRKTCEELTIHMQSMQTELAEKIDRESVGFIVHEKYEEIVRYLQDALQSSMEDENNFKEKADEIQEMVVLLSNSKADRTEIANMQEVMVKSEALLKKVGAQVNIKEKMKELVTRQELEELLTMKVDRLEFENQLQNAVSSVRRTKKMSSLSTGLPPVQDEALHGHLPGIQDHIRQVESPPTTASLKARGLTPPVNGDKVLFIDPPNNNQPVQQAYQPIPVIAIGQSLGGSSPPKSKSDFGSYVKSKGKHKGTVLSSSAGSLPSADVPGAFRKASEGGRPGGQQDPRSSHPQLEGYGATEYPFVADPNNYSMPYADQSNTTDHLAYLHGPLVGGGFNARSAHILRSMPGNKAVAPDDVEGKGL
jgi:hypothetical protein